MKLVLAWLLGVPLLVGSMVLARAAFLPPGAGALEVPPPVVVPAPAALQVPITDRGCLAPGGEQRMTPPVAQQPDPRGCEPPSVP